MKRAKIKRVDIFVAYQKTPSLQLRHLKYVLTNALVCRVRQVISYGFGVWRPRSIRQCQGVDRVILSPSGTTSCYLAVSSRIADALSALGRNIER